MILGTMTEFFGGYQWQKKCSNFQSSAIAEKSMGIVDEFDMEQLLQEAKGQNEWKQRLDQEDCCYIDRKGVQGLSCTRYFPFVMASNRTFSWYYKQVCESFKRRICAVEFH
jgi:phage/plasmid-associated DNA primase